jgi:hypothetical protein
MGQPFLLPFSASRRCRGMLILLAPAGFQWTKTFELPIKTLAEQ